MPIVLGDEGAGVVESVGPGVSDLRAGDHVVLSWTLHCGTCRRCSDGAQVLCPHVPTDGRIDSTRTCFHDAETDAEIFHYGPATYSPYVVVPASSAIKIRDDLPLEHAALLGCSIPTGLGAVTRSAQVRPGQSVAVFGCGGVGLNALQGARLVGANPIIAADTTADKLSFAQTFGATHGVDVTDVDAVDTIVEISGGGVDCAVVAVGSTQAIETAARCVGDRGTLVVVGAPPHGATINLDPSYFLAKERRMIGCRYGSFNPQADFPVLADLCASGRIDVASLITRRYTIDQANQSFLDLADGLTGRGLIVF